MSRRPFSPSLVAIATLLAILSLAGLASADEPAAPADQAPADQAPVAEVVPGPADVADKVAPARSPMLQEIEAAWQASDVAVAEFERQLAAAADATAALALQRQIEDLRLGAEIRILEIQARYARQEGRLEQAAEIEAAIVEMTAPRPRSVPIERPLPAGER